MCDDEERMCWAYLAAGVGTGQEIADGGTGDGGSGTGVATLDILDGLDRDLFLAKAGDIR